ncbi:hypothetical protein POM88_028605 [Heracleum sosnowskyi]|uniref:Uncharacterized protein n=1 Tax=Heracleum sosnowskyi TaxID=360622 RepID=A0AAD8HS47_9APIA|nr:hypothetical protein POM88_028605 [Heracleum sosnowskyi]
MAPRKEKGKSKATASKGSTNRRASRAGSPASPPSSPSPPPSPCNPNTHRMTAAEERAWRGRKPRTNSMGKFGEKRPRKPARIDIHGARIFDDTAKKTLLAIIREQWSVGLYTYTDIIAKNPRWMEEVVTEFKVYVSSNQSLNFLLELLSF